MIRQANISIYMHEDKEAQDLLHLLSDAQHFEQGFRLLVTQYQERLYWHIRKMVQSHEDADDVLQNTFVKVYRGIKSFKGESKLYTWLYRIATNEALTFLKKRKRRQTAALDQEDLGLENKVQAQESVDGQKAQRLLQEAITILPEKQQLVFSLRYYDEMPYKQMSEDLNTSVGALKASYHHAVKKIEAYIKANL